MDTEEEFIAALKEGSYFQCGLIQALEHFTARRKLIFPEPLIKLAHMKDEETNHSLFQVYLYKSIDETIIEDPAIQKSKELLFHSFKISEIDVLEKLFGNVTTMKNMSMVCITAMIDGEFIVAATSLFGTSVKGCYIGYLSVLNLDLKGITKTCRSSNRNIKGNSFERLGLGSFLVLFIQLVTYETCKTWHLYTWSNNKKKTKDIWIKLGFEIIYSVNPDTWPDEIEDIAKAFLLPKDIATKDKLTPKRILSAISSMQYTPATVVENVTAGENSGGTVVPYLTLDYFKDNWYNYQVLEKVLSDNDPIKLSLYWLKNKVTFEQIEDAPNNDAKMFYYLIKNRLDCVSSNVILTGAKNDLREITSLEGFISEVSMEYCLILLFLQYRNVYPIWVETFLLWFRTRSYEKMKSELTSCHPYTDCDVIEREANNPEFMFFIPFFEGAHYTSIFRCWIEERIHFLFIETADVHKQYRYTTAAKELPYKVFRFLMNSPLWPKNTSVFWSQLPVVEQTEVECGFRTLLHSFILSQSKDPYYCLQPLHCFGTNTIKDKRNVFYKWTNASLSMLCREWVKEMMYNKCWVVKDWMKELLNNGKKFSYPRNWKKDRCVEIMCNDENIKEFDNAMEAAEEEQDVQMKAAVEKPNVVANLSEAAVEKPNIVANPAEKEVAQILVKDISHIGRKPQLAALAKQKDQNKGYTSCDAGTGTEQDASLAKTTEKSITNDVLNTEKDAVFTHEQELINKGARFALDQDIHNSEAKEQTSESTILVPETDCPVANNNININTSIKLSTCIDGATGSYLMKEKEQTNDASLALANKKDGTNTSVGFCNDKIVSSSQEKEQINVTNIDEHVITETDQNNESNKIALPESEPTINENFVTYIEDDAEVLMKKRNTRSKEITLPNQKFNSWKGPRRVRQFTPRQKIITFHKIGMLYCGVCKHTVTDKYKCSQCSEFIHKLCGFVVLNDTTHTYTCKGCFDSSNVTYNKKLPKRLRLTTIKDTELSNSWAEKKKRGTSETLVSKSTVTLPELPPLRSLDEQIKEFNKWLSQVYKVQCRVSRDGKKEFLGCYQDGSHMGDIYEKYFIQTLFENEEELLHIICNKENRNKWYTLPNAFGKLFRQRGRCFSNTVLFQSFDLLERHIWSFMKFNTYNREEPHKDFVMIDQATNFKRGTYYISLATANKEHIVDYVPKYYILRWMHFCSKYLSFNGTNEYDNNFKKARKYSNKWVEIDAGAQKRKFSEFTEQDMYSDAPSIFKKQSDGEYSCVFSSLISALHYINDYSARDLLMANLPASLNYSLMCDESNSRAGFASKLLNKNCGYYSTIISNFNVFTDMSIWPTLCILKGSDNSVNHAITVVQDYIFDSNRDKAMYINQNNLDWCCSSESSKVSFVSVVKAYRFIRQNPSPQLLIREKEYVERAIQSAVRVFYSIQDRDASLALEHLTETVQPNENFMSAIAQTLNTKPFRYKVQKMKESSDDFINAFHSSPTLCLITDESESLFTVISIMGCFFFDGSRSPPIKLTQQNISLILTSGNSESAKIKLYIGYVFIKPIKGSRVL